MIKLPTGWRCRGCGKWRRSKLAATQHLNACREAGRQRQDGENASEGVSSSINLGGGHRFESHGDNGYDGSCSEGGSCSDEEGGR